MKQKTKFLKRALCGALILLLAGTLIACSRGSGSEVVQSSTEKKLEKIQGLIDKNYLNEVDENSMVEGIYSGYVSGLDDPYSEYYDQEETDEFMESTSGEYVGIGAVLSEDQKTGIITILTVYEDSPAMEAGLKDEDILYKVEDQDVTGVELTDVVALIKGEAGTQVELTVLRGEAAEEITVTAVREKVEAVMVQTKMLEDDIGYLALTEFDTVAFDQYEEGLKELREQGMKGLIVDLRNNPGGNLEVVCEILNIMLPEGLIVYTEDKNGNKKEYECDGKNPFTDPLVVLVNGNSASASEIYAGAIQDYGIGKIVGTQTYGKGVVQQLFDLGDGSSLKLTVSQYFTPKGRSINDVGITPDVEVEYEADEQDEEADNQLDRAVEVLKEEM